MEAGTTWAIRPAEWRTAALAVPADARRALCEVLDAAVYTLVPHGDDEQRGVAAAEALRDALAPFLPPESENA